MNYLLIVSGKGCNGKVDEKSNVCNFISTVCTATAYRESAAMALSRHHPLYHRMRVRLDGRLARYSARARLPCNERPSELRIFLPTDSPPYSVLGGPTGDTQ